MGIFITKKLSERQTENLNKILPEKLQKLEWSESDFKGQDNIYNRFEYYIIALNISLKKDNDRIQETEEKLNEIPIKYITIFNTELFEAEPLGMVDIGVVKRFGAASTGDRFANGAIGYAVENALDDTWSKNNAQENAVNEVKLQLLEKTKKVYPNCNLLYKYQVDFREIGTSGNVFIYMRGTAAKGKNDNILKAQKEAKKEISNIKEKITEVKNRIQELQNIKNKIPSDHKQIEELLGL